MPFVSQAQRKFLYANKPEVAKQLEQKTPKKLVLPKKLKKKS